MLDEPCSALDMMNTVAIEGLLMELKTNYTIIIVTHNLSQAKRLVDDIIFMDNGKIKAFQEKNDFFESPFSYFAKKQIELM